MASKFSVKLDLNKIVKLQVSDITKVKTDAIVNAANKTLLGGGGVDGAIHAAAGDELLKECQTLNGCNTGEAKITRGYMLPAKWVIHTVGPIGEKQDKLRNCYINSLNVAKQNNVKSIAFPCISTGIYGYPNKKAAHVALSSVREWLEKNPDSLNEIIFCLFLQIDVHLYEKLKPVYFPTDEDLPDDNRDSDSSKVKNVSEKDHAKTPIEQNTAEEPKDRENLKESNERCGNGKDKPKETVKEELRNADACTKVEDKKLKNTNLSNDSNSTGNTEKNSEDVTTV